MTWYYMDGDVQKGPVEFDEILGLIRSKKLPPDVQVWTEGEASWVAANTLPKVAALVGAKDLPQHASERVREMVGGGGQGRLFTSDLSVNEFLLVKKAGFEPLGLVIGSSIYHIGYQQSQWNQNQEMAVLSQAMYHARDLAMTRMEAECDALGADGVVGVRLEVGRYEWGENLAEFLAIGTAVKSADGQSHRTPEGKPFTSDLSGQDLYVLRSMGYAPVGLVMGNCVYHVAHQIAPAVLQDRVHERRDGELHPGPLRRPRAGHGAHAARGPQAEGRGDRGREHQGSEPRLGKPRHRILRRRNRDREPSRLRRPKHPAPCPGCP